MDTYTNLSYGSQGDDVKKMQQSLINAGYDLGGSGADGVFGTKTQAAVKQYQTDNGLNVDGVAGSNTLGKLYGGVTAKTSAPVQPTSSGSGTYDPSADQAYQDALNALQNAEKNMPSYQNSYEAQLKDIYDKIMNRDKFSYDLNSDMLYQQYRDQYASMGQMAMMDTMGQTAALTGGYGSSYGQAVGQQQYDAYLQQLNNVIPELYGMARDNYDREGQELYDLYGLTGNMADDEYAKYMDSYNQWLNERNYLTGQADTAYDRGYQQWLAEYTMKQDALAQEQWEREFAEAQRQYDLAHGVGGAGGSSGGGSGGGSGSGSGNGGNGGKGSSGGGGQTYTNTKTGTTMTTQDIMNAATNYYKQHPDVKVDSRTIDNWLADNGYTGASSNNSSSVFKAALQEIIKANGGNPLSGYPGTVTTTPPKQSAAPPKAAPSKTAGGNAKTVKVLKY